MDDCWIVQSPKVGLIRPVTSRNISWMVLTCPPVPSPRPPTNMLWWRVFCHEQIMRSCLFNTNLVFGDPIVVLFWSMHPKQNNGHKMTKWVVTFRWIWAIFETHVPHPPYTASENSIVTIKIKKFYAICKEPHFFFEVMTFFFFIEQVGCTL
jgi:hypothetical protein